jgi:uncharacterized membrane protein YidH (DUF202 family)
VRLQDPGAQPERTALAWSRTTLSLVGAGLLCVRLAPSATGTVLAAAVVCGGAALMVRRTRMSFHHRRLPSRTGAADPASIMMTTALAVLLAAVAVALAF